MVVDAGSELFASIGLTSSYVGTIPQSDVPWAETLSIIGLAGNLRGSLVLSVPTGLVRRSHPTGGVHPDDLADWLAELANLMLGGITLSTPLTISATTFRVERFVGTPVVHAFQFEGETICVVFEAVSPERAVLAADRIPAAVKSGEMITF
jgi:hypothetical protein